MRFIIPIQRKIDEPVSSYVNYWSMQLIIFKRILKGRINKNKLLCRKQSLLNQPNIQWIITNNNYDIVSIVESYVNHLQCFYDGNNITGDCLLTHEHYEDGRSPTGSETAVLLDGLESKKDDGTLAQNTIFPDVYSVTDAENTDAEKFLSSPSKVVGIKPKKLVIADDGLAFYTEADGSLAYKNINRLVTIDLEEFVIESIQATNATFNSELSDYLRTATNLAPIASGGGTLVTNVSEGASCYYYAGSSMGWQAVDVATKADFIYLSVKPGE